MSHPTHPGIKVVDKTLRSFSSSSITSDDLGELEIIADGGTSVSFYMKDGDGNGIDQRARAYKCIIAQMNIPKSFHHLEYDLANQGIVSASEVEKPFRGEAKNVVANITTKISTQRLFMMKDGVPTKDVPLDMLQGESFTYDYRLVDWEADPISVLACGILECREVFKHNEDTLDKVFARIENGLLCYYIPTLGRNQGDEIFNVVYFKTSDQSKLWSWLTISQGPRAGVAVNKPLPAPIVIDGVPITVVTDTSVMDIRPDCEALLL